MSRSKLLAALLVERFGPARLTAVEADRDPPKAVAKRRRELAEALRGAPAGDASDDGAVRRRVLLGEED